MPAIDTQKLDIDNFYYNVFKSQIIGALLGTDIEFKDYDKLTHKIMTNLHETFYFLHKVY